MNNESEGMCTEAAFEAVSGHFPGGTEEQYTKPQS
jgi:hypothetical protein